MGRLISSDWIYFHSGVSSTIQNSFAAPGDHPPERVLEVVAKAARREALTAQERAVLDPDDPTPGVRRKPPRKVTTFAREHGHKVM